MTERKIIVTVGLPGSGKTTWAAAWIDEHPDFVRINKDTLRSMLHADRKYDSTAEPFVCVIRDCAIEHALIAGYNIVIDDTNLNPKHIYQIKAAARRYAHNDMVVLRDFTDVPLEVCKERNRNRTDKTPIPDEDIMRMYNDHFEDGKWKHRDLLS